MKEEIITFKTAVLAEEKGFIHMKANCYGDNMCYQLPQGELINALKGNTVSGYILAPTQSLLQKWLREYHDLSIKIDDFITDSKIRYDYSISVLGSQTDNPTGLFESYEEALEEGLQKMLLSISVNHAKM